MGKPYKLLAFWFLCLLAYLIPWAESNKGLLQGFNLIPFTFPYLLGLLVGLLPIIAGGRRLFVAIVASILMLFGVLLVLIYWYSLALHYGGVAELEVGIWIALVVPLLYLLGSIYVYSREIG